MTLKISSSQRLHITVIHLKIDELRFRLKEILFLMKINNLQQILFFK